jgi:putative DNA primase/helicase
MDNLDQERAKGTGEIIDGSNAEVASSPIKTSINLEITSPINTKPACLNKTEIKRPSYETHDDWFLSEGHELKPGLYFHNFDTNSIPIDIWICSPIYADALTANEHGWGWGLLLRFINPDGKWREWAMPNHMLKGSGEDIRGALFDMGVLMSPKEYKSLHAWLASRNPKRRLIAATRTGWHETELGKSFVLLNTVLGADSIRFQSEDPIHDDFIQRGSLEDWINNISVLCRDNKILLLAISAAFAGPLLKIAKLQDIGGAGIHLIGDSSRGKTTALQVAASVWGSPSFMRTWRATANGLEAIAAARNDTFLPLDECGESDPREVGLIVYALANGLGKQRAKRTGDARQAARWRTIVLSSGECSISTHMSESGKRIKAGQQARLLDVLATNFEYGAFQHLHGDDNGRAFADRLKRATNKYYGQPGLNFIQKLLDDTKNFSALYADTCAIPAFFTVDGIEARAAGTFALIGMAGELATEYGLTGWQVEDALNAAIYAFNTWREYRGSGKTEDRQILQYVRNFILRHGDSRFSKLGLTPNENIIIRDRAGWWDNTDNERRVYLFNSEALKEAASGFELPKILDVLDKAGWIIERNSGKRSKKVRVNGFNMSLYFICPLEGEEI